MIWQVFIFKKLQINSFYLKEMGHEIFDPYIFHDSKPSGPLINSLKYFRFRFRIFDHKVISAVCIFPRRWSRGCAAHGGKDLRGVLYTISIVCSAPLRWSPQCASYRWDDLCGVRQTAHRGDEIKIFSCHWLLLKGQLEEILLGVKEKIWSIKCWFT